MFEKFAGELAVYEYNYHESVRLKARQSADYWNAKYHGLARDIEIATGYYPSAICHGESVEVHIGDYQAVKFFG